MKKIISFMLALVLSLSTMTISVMADEHKHNTKTVNNSNSSMKYTYCTNPGKTYVNFSLDKYPESDHDYANNIKDKVYSYSVPGADSLSLKFSQKCLTEQNFDIVTVKSSDGKVVGEYSGSQLAGRTVDVPSGSFTVEFKSDHSKTFYGFSIDSITAYNNGFSYYVPDVKKNGTAHNYSNYADETVNYYVPGASSVSIKFSDKCLTEKDYDIVYIMDSTGKNIGTFSGSELASRVITVNDSAFSIRFVSDRSKTYYGYSIDSITALMNGVTQAMPDYSYELTVPEEYYPESQHNYSNYLNETYAFRYPNAKSLKVKFNSQTKTEETYDTITIYDEYNNKVGTYSGDQLASRVVNIPSGSFKIEFKTDRSKTFYGFSIDSIVAEMNVNPEVVGDSHSDAFYNQLIPHTSHEYSNNAEETYVFTDATASSLDLMFSPSCLTEKNFDIVTVYDENDKLIGEYSGNELANKFMHINGSTVKIKFTSDHSKTYYGYGLNYLSPNYLSKHEGSNVYSYPESAHNYNSYATETYEYYCDKPMVSALELQFSDKCYTEPKYDVISIYDSNNKLIGSYSGSQLAGKKIKVSGSYFKIVLKTDRSAIYYGFSLDNITAVYNTDYYKTDEISHNYVLTNAVKPSDSTDEKMYYTCVNCGDFKEINDNDFNKFTYTLSSDSFDYDGKTHIPDVTIKDAGKTLREGTDYTLTKPSKSVQSGLYTITVDFKGGYKGRKYLYYRINTYNETQNQSYRSYLLSLGFPTSYVSKLVSLHEQYPNWEFRVYDTGLDWQTAVDGERTPHSKQRIGVGEHASSDFLCDCSKCKGVIIDSSYAASEKAVKYYMDPRNWLDERHIFQFESTNGGEGQTQAGVEGILNGTWMHNSLIYFMNTEGNLSRFNSTTKYSDVIMIAAQKSGLSPYYIASKIKQEVGAKDASFAGGSNGTTAPFQGIYNYFNIGAYAGAKDGLAWAAGFLKVKDGYSPYLYSDFKNGTGVNAVKKLDSSQRMVYIDSYGDCYKVRLYTEDGNNRYTTGQVGYVGKLTVRNTYVGDDLGGPDQYQRPWTNPYRAIVYGSKWVYNGYGKYQYTGYLQKFNVTADQRHEHEYMVNISSAQSEAGIMYNGYKTAGLLSDKHVFYIPVFKNM